LSAGKELKWSRPRFGENLKTLCKNKTNLIRIGTSLAISQSSLPARHSIEFESSLTSREQRFQYRPPSVTSHATVISVIIPLNHPLMSRMEHSSKKTLCALRPEGLLHKTQSQLAP